MQFNYYHGRVVKEKFTVRMHSRETLFERGGRIPEKETFKQKPKVILLRLSRRNGRFFFQAEKKVYTNTLKQELVLLVKLKEGYQGSRVNIEGV